METIKSYTDLEQSKKLAEILSLESADMAYIASATDNDGETLYTAEYKSEIIIYEADDYINCWSLAALLDVLPTGKVLLHDKGNRGYKCICNNIDSYYFNNPIDACVDMVEKLHELKML